MSAGVTIEIPGQIVNLGDIEQVLAPVMGDLRWGGVDHSDVDTWIFFDVPRDGTTEVADGLRVMRALGEHRPDLAFSIDVADHDYAAHEPGSGFRLLDDDAEMKKAWREVFGA